MGQENHIMEHFDKEPLRTYLKEAINQSINQLQLRKKQSNEENIIKDIIKDIILVLITRKGYGLIKTMMKLETDWVENLRESSVRYISDRYVLKLVSADEEIAGKNIIIFDDTITNGNNMFYYYCMFKKKKAAQVIPQVLVASTEFLSKMAKHNKEVSRGNSKYIEEAKREEFKRIYKAEDDLEHFPELLNDFYRDFRYRMVMPADDVAEFSIQETLWFQENLNPMVMDLPVFRYEDEKKEREIILTEEEFKRICTSTSKWQFVKNSYNVLDQEVRCDFFQLNDELIYRQFHNLFFNFVVKCKFIECEQGIKIVFIPFAMVKSGTMIDVWRCFQGLLGDTEYYKYICAHLEIKDTLDEGAIVSALGHDHNISRGVFRAVIFSLSNYIGYLFQKKLTEEIGKTIYFDTEYLRDHCDDAFVRTFETEYLTMDGNEYIKKIATVKNSGSSIVLPIEYDGISGKEIASEQNVELCVRERILTGRHGEKPRKFKIATIEGLEEELDRKYRFDSREQKRLYLTKTLIRLLEISCCGNEIVVDNEDSMIYRGFRAGENSEILMEDGLKWVYPYYYAFYYYQNGVFFVKNYKKFKQWLRDRFYSQEYVNTLISQISLEFYIRYFDMVKDNNLHEQILNKAYLLRDYWEDNVTDECKDFVQQAFLSVKKWGDQIHAEGMD